MTDKMDKAALLNDLYFVRGAMGVTEEGLSIADAIIWKRQRYLTDKGDLMTDVVNSMKTAESAFVEVCDKLDALIEQVKKMEKA